MIYYEKQLDRSLILASSKSERATFGRRRKVVAAPRSASDFIVCLARWACHHLSCCRRREPSTPASGNYKLCAFCNSRLLTIVAVLLFSMENNHAGSSVARDGLATTEVRLNAATYIKFEDISNAQLLELEPSKLTTLNAVSQPPSSATTSGRQPDQLDTSFNIHLSLENALEKLQSESFGQLGSQQQTPALGKFSQHYLTFSFSPFLVQSRSRLIRLMTAAVATATATAALGAKSEPKVEAERRGRRRRKLSHAAKSLPVGKLELALACCLRTLIPSSDAPTFAGSVSKDKGTSRRRCCLFVELLTRTLKLSSSAGGF